MTTLPGRGGAVDIRKAATPDTIDRAMSLAGRSVVSGGTWYEGRIMAPLRISRAFSEPLRSIPSFDRLTIDHWCEPASESIADMYAAWIRLYRETGGAFDQSSDLLWLGRVPPGGVRRSKRRQTVEGIDFRGFALENATVGGRSVDEENYPDAADRHRDRPIPVCFGDFSQGALAVEALCIEKRDNVDSGSPTGDPLYIYQDTHDWQGELMTTTASGFAVWYYDAQDYSTIREAWEAGGITSITSHCTASHDHTEATFEVDVSGVGITWDVQRHVVLVQFKAPTCPDTTITSAATLAVDGCASILTRLYVSHAGLSADYIDTSVIEAIDAKSPLVYNWTTGSRKTSDLIGSLLADLFIQERFTDDGVSWRTRWDFEPLAATITVAERHHVDWPTEDLSPFSPHFTTLTVERNYLPYAPDELISSGPVRDDLLIAENGGQEVRHTHKSEWLGHPDDMRSLAEYMLPTRSRRSRTIRARFKLDDAQHDQQTALLPGDVIRHTFPGFSAGELRDVLAVTHDLLTGQCDATMWVLDEPGVYGSIYATDGSGATPTVTSATVGLFEFMDGWSGDGVSSNMTPAYAAGGITVQYGGLYLVAWTAALEGDAATYSMQVGTDTVLAGRYFRSEASVTLPASNTIRAARGFALWELEANDGVGVVVKASASSKSVKLHVGSLFCARIARRA